MSNGSERRRDRRELPLPETVDAWLGQLRMLAGVGSLMPVVAGAVGVGLLARNRRRGVNFFTSNWPRLVLLTTGVTLNVVGAENLTAQRPAVFIFNHRNNFDPVITAVLVRDNWTGVAKRELQNNPIAGPIGRVLDTAFIDRDDRRSAVEGLHKIEKLAKDGLSIIIAPEGTRVDTIEVGPFKKGPFKIAMAAGIPIVPIVIRNAEAVSDRDARSIRSGTVDVAVFPPISVAHWNESELPDRIEQIRRLYLDTLKNWPHDRLTDVGCTREK
jgi:putative phosphoserine phosphatase/1-acylglycerol-3-phosphate O-acyltransferase